MTVPPQDLILLGLLAERPQHGYELKQAIESYMSEIAKVAPGTIYYTLKKLEKRGLIRSSAERKGNRPERRVYELTDEGETAFKELLGEALNIDERPYYIFDAAFFFFEHLDEEALRKSVDVRIRRIEKFRQRVENIQKENPGQWPWHLEALRKKASLYSEAMEAWYRYLQAGLKDSKPDDPPQPPASAAAQASEPSQ